MAALVIIIVIDLVIVAAVLIYGTRHDHHPVSVESPSIKALTGQDKPGVQTASSKSVATSQPVTE